MTDSANCLQCRSELDREDRFCPQCGRPTGSISWSLSLDGQPGKGPIRIRPGDRLFLVARNTGLDGARVEVDAGRADGLRLTGVSAGRVPAGQTLPFELRQTGEEILSGALIGRSLDGPRRMWWERADWRATEFRLPGEISLSRDRWVIGSPTIVFPPGVRMQPVRVWNDAGEERVFQSTPPQGYKIINFGNPIEKMPPSIGGLSSVELRVQAASGDPRSPADPVWKADAESEPIPLISLARSSGSVGPDVVVAIDFGTRNTGIRLRWRRTLLPDKPAGTVDIVSDRSGAPRFPTAMVLHRRERTFLWGTEAAERIDRNLLDLDEVAVDNLKTDLRLNQERFTAYRADWTNQELLFRYFERLIGRIDDYFQTAQPGTALSRDSLNIRYIMARPVLDANSGDEQGRLYEQALRFALERCGISEDQVTFVQEPVAAAVGIAKRHEKELILLENTAIAVVDSGGGTTDIALARIRLTDGQLKLEVAGSYALRIAEDNPVLAALNFYRQNDHIELGGNAIDCALAYQLETDAEALLETDDRPVPSKLSVSLSEEPQESAATRQREFLTNCRKMKEGFAFRSRQYLNRSPDRPIEENETFPFPNRPEYAGIYLDHALFYEFLEPILGPIVGDLRELMAHSQEPSSGIRPNQVRRVFYVGGTDIDGFVRQHFGRAFPMAPAETDERTGLSIEERLNVVVEGAVWSEEQLFAPSPLTLILLASGKETPLIAAGAALRPESAAQPRFATCDLEPQEALDASLIASGGGLKEPVTVARAFYRNSSDGPQEVSLCVTVSREKGAVAVLRVQDRSYDQWRFNLTGIMKE